MKFVVDVNLSRKWIKELEAAGFDAVYWTDLGAEDDADEIIMAWAKENGATVLTSDLDFAAMLAASGGEKPSVVQLRPDRHRPELLIGRLTMAVKAYHQQLEEGYLLTVDFAGSRISRLPLKTFK